MATVNEIERLRQLVERLLPISRRDAGDVIAARDWNTVVGALLEVARAVVDGGSTHAVEPHDHPDQVRMGWLEPRLRALIERGPMDDPVALGRIGAVERGIGAVDKRLDELVSSLRDVRTATTRLETQDLGRDATITRLGRKMDGLGDARDDVTSVRETLDSLRGDLTSLLTFSAGLEGLTPADLLDHLQAIDELRARLTTPTGALLDAAEFERRLVELSTTLVTEEELSEALAGVRTQIPEDVYAQLLDAVRRIALEQTQEIVGPLTEQLDQRITSRLKGVQTAAVRAATEEAARVADGLRGPLRDEVTEALRSEIATGDDMVREAVGTQLAQAIAGVRGELDDRVKGVRNELPDLVGKEVDQRRPDIVAAATAAVTPALTSLGTRMTAAEADAASLRSTVVTTSTDLATFKQQTSANFDKLASDLRKVFTRDLNEAVAELQASQDALAERFSGEMAAERARVDKELEAIRRLIGKKDEKVAPTEEDPAPDKPRTKEARSVEAAETSAAEGDENVVEPAQESTEVAEPEAKRAPASAKPAQGKKRAKPKHPPKANG
ncbi:hypothetical protein [Actinophytocola sp.]|uniref:hypothetical protein n=1 Tax=Actinophytocola sp. TaxID=1872138 RepID=UPI002D58127A|nr:hypothetical protein [Actinophytocola sp.]HYQ68292.1 hypothetical protein [Actinophytocola sp.]